MKQSEITEKFEKAVFSRAAVEFKANIKDRYTCLTGLVFGEDAELDDPSSHALQSDEEVSTYHLIVIDDSLRGNTALKDMISGRITDAVLIRIHSCNIDVFCKLVEAVFKVKL